MILRLKTVLSVCLLYTQIVSIGLRFVFLKVSNIGRMGHEPWGSKSVKWDYVSAVEGLCSNDTYLTGDETIGTPTIPTSVLMRLPGGAISSTKSLKQGKPAFFEHFKRAFFISFEKSFFGCRSASYSKEKIRSFECSWCTLTLTQFPKPSR
jgi:hypothetical protein